MSNGTVLVWPCHVYKTSITTSFPSPLCSSLVLLLCLGFNASPRLVIVILTKPEHRKLLSLIVEVKSYYYHEMISGDQHHNFFDHPHDPDFHFLAANGTHLSSHSDKFSTVGSLGTATFALRLTLISKYHDHLLAWL